MKPEEIAKKYDTEAIATALKILEMQEAQKC